MSNQMIEPLAVVDPSVTATQIAAPAYADGADLAVVAQPHDQSFWDRHPDVATYRVTVSTGIDADKGLTVLIWLKPEAPRSDSGFIEPAAAEPPRPADLVFTTHAAHGLGFFARHPDLETWKTDLALGRLAGHGADHTVSLWVRPRP